MEDLLLWVNLKPPFLCVPISLSHHFWGHRTSCSWSNMESDFLFQGFYLFFFLYDITHIWNLHVAQMNLSTERKSWTCVAKGETKGVVWIGSFSLIDAAYRLWNRLAMRSCCVALGTMSGHLWWRMIMWEKIMYTCMCNWVTMLYCRKINK